LTKGRHEPSGGYPQAFNVPIDEYQSIALGSALGVNLFNGTRQVRHAVTALARQNGDDW
jgi:hypothetical protein